MNPPDFRRLFRSRCPSCNKDMAKCMSTDVATNNLVCKCGFTISPEKMQSILSRSISKQINDRQL